MLNAFRHQRKELSSPAIHSPSVWLCSTPFGINGRNSTGPWAMWLQRGSAQRLSASTEGTRPFSSTVASIRVLCSTPFGINGRNSASGLHLLCWNVVLNAFRHQRKELIGHGRRSLPRCTCSTPFGINGRNSRAYRPILLRHGLCSTPFGINGENSTEFRLTLLPSLRAQRLSASTEGTHGRWVLPTPVKMCSTPFGINGRNSRKLGQRGAQRRRAQRLSASTAGPPPRAVHRSRGG